MPTITISTSSGRTSCSAERRPSGRSPARLRGTRSRAEISQEEVTETTIALSQLSRLPLTKNGVTLIRPTKMRWWKRSTRPRSKRLEVSSALRFCGAKQKRTTTSLKNSPTRLLRTRRTFGSPDKRMEVKNQFISKK